MRILLLAMLMGSTARADDCHSQIMIVLDRSCSMNQPPKAGVMQTKWELAGLALQKITTDYAGKLDFGLIMFPDQTGDKCLQDGPIYVNVGPGNESTVVAKVMGTMPTGPCVTNIKPAVDQVATDPAFAQPFSAGSRRFVLFISDGMQTCGGDDTMIAASFKKLFDNGYPSYIVGFGNGVDPTALDSFATAGGVPRAVTSGDGGGRLYYQADDAQQLDDALAKIVGTIAAEFSVCPGVPCPDNRCFQSGTECTMGFCQSPAPSPTTTGSNGGNTGSNGGNTGSNGGSNGGDGGSSTGGSASTAGCGCDLGGATPAIPALPFLLFFVIRVTRRFTRGA